SGRLYFFFSSRRRHTRFSRDWSSDVCSSDLELRTPITALLGTLEVTQSKTRSAEEYKSAIAQLEQYTLDLQDTLEQMMLLSGAKTSFELKPIRVDEVMWQVIENMVLYHEARIEVDIQVKNSNLLTVEANDKLLELAFGNILENAIKYSDNQVVRVVFQEQDGKLVSPKMICSISDRISIVLTMRENIKGKV